MEGDVFFDEVFSILHHFDLILGVLSHNRTLFYIARIGTFYFFTFIYGVFCIGNDVTNSPFNL